MKYFLRASIIPLLYLFFQATVSIAIFGIKTTSIGLGLLGLNMAIFIFTISVFSYQNGEKAFKALLLNDVERRIIVETGEDRPLNLVEEYSPLKGVILGLIPVVPLFVLILAHFIIYIAGGGYLGVGAIAVFLYKAPYAIFEYLGYQTTMTNCFLTLLSVPMVFIPIFVSYVLGARNARLKNDKIEEDRKSLHGEK